MICDRCRLSIATDGQPIEDWEEVCAVSDDPIAKLDASVGTEECEWYSPRKYIEIDGVKCTVKECEECPVYDDRGICQHPKNDRGFSCDGVWLDGCPLREVIE